MNTLTFESRLLPDGHLYCPKEFSHKKNALFKVLVISEDKASDTDIELSAISDNSENFLSEEEVRYYLDLEEL
ncbi:MAG: hypothetical protein BWK80_34205 [Desulfobacteraceae bacterium IS3]|nr:MAG: hypothetical protein BWK80_34205 [Desulfobacteraceae bacterium IS3]